MKISIGRMVTFKGMTFNGTLEHPAIITRDWSNINADPINGPIAVNVTVFPDGSPPFCLSSVPMFDSRQAAATQPGYACFWPDRV